MISLIESFTGLKKKNMHGFIQVQRFHGEHSIQEMSPASFLTGQQMLFCGLCVVLIINMELR